MGGGLMQLVAYGAQDIYLTGNPQITFFKVVYRRHTNFAMESIEQTFNGAAEMGNKFSCTIARNGDLLSQVYLEMDVGYDFTFDVEKFVIDDGGTLLNVNTASTTNSPALGGPTYSVGDDGSVTIYKQSSVLTGADSVQVLIQSKNGAGAAALLNINEDLHFDKKISDSNTAGSKRIGQRIIDSVEVEIGGQTIDKHYGDWMDIWAGLTYSNEEYTKWNRLLDGKLVANSNVSVTSGGTTISHKAGRGNEYVSKMYVPLQFWFCRNPGLALPLIALQYHEVKINVEFSQMEYELTDSDFDNGELFNNTRLTITNASGTSIDDSSGNSFTACAGTTYNVSFSDLIVYLENIVVKPKINNCCVFCDYIFLDTDERRRFAQVSHEYLIEQVQYSNALSLSDGNNQHNLRFNHPVKEIVWSAQTTDNADKNFNYFGASGVDMINTALLQLNGHDRMKKRDGTYFRCVQPYQHHTGADGQSNSDEYGGYYCYSFGLKPEEHQPSGTCNFSRIDNAVLSLNATANGQLKVYAVNYNVLRIMSGMGGLAYSN